MISANLKGGLGNQMFQIAAAHALALRTESSSCFNLEGCYTPLQGNPSMKYRDNILLNVNHSIINYWRGVYHEPKFSYDELPNMKALILDGYFQSEKYFIDYKKEIVNLFNISIENKTKIKDSFSWWGLQEKPITSVHIRRGDYLNNPDFHPTCTIEYYEKAIKEIGDSYFIFVSDDIEWVKQNFKTNSNDYVFSNFNDEILDLTLMTMCDNNIIANSSFSWWGAYLNPNQDKKVIAPKKWFGPKGPQDQSDIIPENWLIID
jgi:hypothetical protein